MIILKSSYELLKFIFILLKWLLISHLILYLNLLYKLFFSPINRQIIIYSIKFQNGKFFSIKKYFVIINIILMNQKLFIFSIIKLKFLIN